MSIQASHRHEMECRAGGGSQDHPKKEATFAVDITIDSEIANLCRALTPEEKSQLEANLHLEGCRDPLVVWGNILLDGHNRHEICTRLGLLFKTAQAPNIRARGDAINWVIANQLGRRNLNPEEQSYLRGKRYKAEKVAPSESGAKGREVQLGHDQNGRPPKTKNPTAKRLGTEFGVGEQTVKRDADFATAVDTIAEKLGKETADMIRTGKSGLPKAKVAAFAKDEDMTLQKFNDLRFEHQQRRAKTQKERKKSAPKHSLTSRKLSDIERDVLKVDRMRPFMNAVIQIATSPVTAATLAGYKWPDGWRKQMNEALAGAVSYLDEFNAAFQLTQKESSSGNDQEAA